MIDIKLIPIVETNNIKKRVKFYSVNITLFYGKQIELIVVFAVNCPNPILKRHGIGTEGTDTLLKITTIKMINVVLDFVLSLR